MSRCLVKNFPSIAHSPSDNNSFSSTSYKINLDKFIEFADYTFSEKVVINSAPYSSVPE